MQGETAPPSPELLGSDVAPGRVAGAGPGRRARRRTALVAALLALAVAAGLILALRRRPMPPGWSAAPSPPPAPAAEIDASARRLLAREASDLADTAGRAGRVPDLAGALSASMDDAAFGDALASAASWRAYRGYGFAALVDGAAPRAWKMPAIGLTAAELAKAVAPDPKDATPRAGLVEGPSGRALAAVAPIAGMPGARLVLAQRVDRMFVARMAARANVAMMLSDGRRDLGASVPDGMMPELAGLVGREAAHVVLERRLGRLAVAVPWAHDLWLWVIIGWEP